MNPHSKTYDVIIIGGGFYGCMLALELRKQYTDILILEKEVELLTKASYNNQARVHNGYHYPRNFVTALRSHLNYKKFIADFKECVDTSNTMVYGIARNNSKVTSSQFVKLCNQIGAPLKAAPNNIRKLFNDHLIENVFLVDEIVFNAAKIRDQLTNAIGVQNIKVLYGAHVDNVTKKRNGLIKVSVMNKGDYISKIVINCTYASINSVLKKSKLSLLPMKYEYAEMPIVTMPEPFDKMGITIMDGPFFSIMPFPDKKMHSFHHVRYTPHKTWIGQLSEDSNTINIESKFLFMKKDAIRYVPLLKDIEFQKSLFEIKTVLMQNEGNDGRPILFRKDHGIKNFHVVMGGKIDNIYDVMYKLESKG